MKPLCVVTSEWQRRLSSAPLGIRHSVHLDLWSTVNEVADILRETGISIDKSPQSKRHVPTRGEMKMYCFASLVFAVSICINKAVSQVNLRSMRAPYH